MRPKTAKGTVLLDDGKEIDVDSATAYLSVLVVRVGKTQLWFPWHRVRKFTVELGGGKQ